MYAEQKHRNKLHMQRLYKDAKVFVQNILTQASEQRGLEGVKRKCFLRWDDVAVCCVIINIGWGGGGGGET